MIVAVMKMHFLKTKTLNYWISQKKIFHSETFINSLKKEVDRQKKDFG